MSISWSGKGRTRRLTLDAALVTVALMLSYLEVLIPFDALIPLPRFKPGLANLVTVLAFVLLTPADALAVSLIRVGLTGLLFGSWTSLFFSMSGAILTFCALLLSRVLLCGCSYLGVSVFCAAAHNTGQILAATVLFGPAVPLSYLPYLLCASAVSGSLTGILLNLSVPRLERRIETWKHG